MAVICQCFVSTVGPWRDAQGVRRNGRVLGAPEPRPCKRICFVRPSVQGRLGLPSRWNRWLQQYLTLVSFSYFRNSGLAVFGPWSASPGARAPPGRSRVFRLRLGGARAPGEAEHGPKAANNLSKKTPRILEKIIQTGGYKEVVKTIICSERSFATSRVVIGRIWTIPRRSKAGPWGHILGPFWTPTGPNNGPKMSTNTSCTFHVAQQLAVGACCR